MKKMLVGLVAGIVLASAGWASAAVSGKSIWLRNGQTIRYGHVYCKATPLNDGRDKAVSCVLSDGSGFATVLSRDMVLVTDEQGRDVFDSWNP